jgi:ribosome maturation factor RimP
MITRETMTALLDPLLTDHGLELVELQIVPGRRRLLRVFIDSASGVNVGNCAQISREITRRLDADPAAGDYVLEVSSPGMNRPIWSLEHFRRFAGEAVRFELKRPRDGELRYTGTIEGVSGDLVQLRVKGGEVLELAVDEIESARLDIDPWQGRR